MATIANFDRGWESKEPMNTKEMIDAMATKGYWSSPGGKGQEIREACDKAFEGLVTLAKTLEMADLEVGEQYDHAVNQLGEERCHMRRWDLLVDRYLEEYEAAGRSEATKTSIRRELGR